MKRPGQVPVPAFLDRPSKNQPRIGITTGDPAGIGPEVCLLAASNPEIIATCNPVLFGSATVLRNRACALGLPFDFEIMTPDALDETPAAARRLIVDIDLPGQTEIVPGCGSRATGESAARSIVECVAGCLRGQLSAMVTAPLNKKFLNEAGYKFPGHTEMLAHLTGVSEFAMAFLTERLKVVLATIHVPLRTAIEQITPAVILSKVGIIVKEFPRLGLRCRELAIAGLNPHSGEGGLLGLEEIEIIEPAVRECRRLFPDINIQGPFPADTLFHRAAQGEFDVVLALYHDQGLTPVKLIGFGEAVNVTLGLPFVRTSVDHGTAYDIAGKGIARPDSLIGAIRWALRLTRPQ